MKKVLLLLLLIMLVSCRGRNSVHQEYDNYGFEINLVTEVYYEDELIDIKFDTINDTIKCYRYNEGIKLIKKLKYLDNLKCN